jgi:phenylacetate-coenzyme A ligase PaaK-like adenylate-forming protein
MGEKDLIKKFNRLLSCFNKYRHLKITAVADIGNIPTADRETLREFSPNDGKAAPAFWHFTSGSTAEAYPLMFSKEGQEALFQRAARAIGVAGIKKGDRVLNLADQCLTDSGWLMSHGIMLLGASVLNCGPITRKTRKTVIDFIERVRPSGLIGMHNSIYSLLSMLDPRRNSFNVVMSGGGVLTKGFRRTVETHVGKSLHNMYGCNEVGIMAMQDDVRDERWLRLIDDDLYFEVINDDGQSRRLGKGRLVVTDLLNCSLPVIRYVIGDYVNVVLKKGTRYIEILGRADRYVNFQSEVVSINLLINAVSGELGHQRFNIIVENSPATLQDSLKIMIDKADALKERAIAAAFEKTTGLKPVVRVTDRPLLKTLGNNKYRNFFDKRAAQLKKKNLLY